MHVKKIQLTFGIFCNVQLKSNAFSIMRYSLSWDQSQRYPSLLKPKQKFLLHYHNNNIIENAKDLLQRGYIKHLQLKNLWPLGGCKL